MLITRPTHGRWKPPRLHCFTHWQKKWATGAGDYEALKIYVCFSCVTADLSVGALVNTSHTPPYNLLLSLAVRHTKGVDRMNLISIDGEGLASIFHSLFCVAGG